MELDPERMIAVLSKQPAEGLDLAGVEGTSPLGDTLRKVTWNSVPEETSANDFGYAASKKISPLQFSVACGVAWKVFKKRIWVSSFSLIRTRPGYIVLM